MDNLLTLGFLNILYEDADVVAVMKPTGLITHSDGRTEEKTAEDWFNAHYSDGQFPNTEKNSSTESSKQFQTESSVEKIGYVHRLDRDTSGVLIFAKNPEAYTFLRKAFHDREVKKTYFAIVYGSPKNKSGNIDFDIGRSRKDFRLRSAQPKAKGRLRDALTRYEVIGEIEIEKEKYAFVKLQPETGRTHQIRVHLKAIHHPIVGDQLYAGMKKVGPSKLGAARLALHAYSIDLPIPSGGRVLITAPIPDDLITAFSHFKIIDALQCYQLYY